MARANTLRALMRQIRGAVDSPRRFARMRGGLFGSGVGRGATPECRLRRSPLGRTDVEASNEGETCKT